MAISDFIPAVWASRLLVNLRKAQVYGQPGVINRDYEGDIAQMGDSVKINSIGAVTVGDYTKDTNMSAAQTLTSAQSVLTINKAKYFNFQVDRLSTLRSKIPRSWMAQWRRPHTRCGIRWIRMWRRCTRTRPAQT